MKIGRMMKKALVAVISIAGLGFVLAWMSGAFHAKIEPHRVEASPRTAKGAATERVVEVIETETTEAVGTLQAERRTAVSAKIMATIAAIPVTAGERVKKGQALVRLDDRDLQAQVAQAKQAIDAAEASSKQAQADLKRMKPLLEQGIIPRSQYDPVESRASISESELQQAREALRRAQVALSYTTIEAPGDGVVVDKQANAGDTAAPGQPLLSIYDPAALRLEAPVPETLATQLKVGDMLPVKMDALNLDLEGRVDEIVPQALAASRSMLIKVAVPKKDGMVEGMFGRLILPARERRRYCLALSAVRAVGQLRFVDVVTSQGVERRAVKLGEHSEFGHVEVLSGLAPGEEVVLYGPAPQPIPEVRSQKQEVRGQRPEEEVRGQRPDKSEDAVARPEGRAR
jgi:RND family efflux transporter MFP subunit